MSVLALSCYEGDITIANICEGLSYILAGKAAGIDVMKKLRYYHPIMLAMSLSYAYVNQKAYTCRF